MPEKSILITRPNHDITTAYLYFWAEEVISTAKSRGIKVLDLKSEKATRKNLESHLIQHKPKLILLNGHGTSTQISGHKNQALIESDNNEAQLKSVITYALACDAAGDLGKKIIEKQGLAFIGYEKVFGFIRDKNKDATPEKDRLPDPFKNASNTIPLSILKGNTVGEAFQKSQNKFLNEIKKHAISDAFPENKHIRFWLFWDMTFQKIYGEKQATFE